MLGEALRDAERRVSSTYGVEFAKACKVAHDHGHSHATIAEHCPYSRGTVGYVLKAYDKSLVNGTDYADEYQAVLDASNAPKAPKPQPGNITPVAKLGDLAREVETTYGDRSLARFAEAIGVDHKTLMNYRTVARAFPESSPRGEFSVSKVLASQPDRHELINEVKTVKEARAKVRERKQSAEVEPSRPILVAGASD